MTMDKFRWIDIAMKQKIGNWFKSLPDLPLSQRKGLYIYGEVGVGKTHLMLGMAKEVIKLIGIETRFTHVPNLFGSLYGQLNNYDNVISPLKKAPLLLLDDLGSEHTSDWTISIMCELLDNRLVNQRLTFVTSNLTPEQIQTVDPRIISRLYAMCAVMQLTGKDGRY